MSWQRLWRSLSIIVGVLGLALPGRAVGGGGPQYQVVNLGEASTGARLPILLRDRQELVTAADVDGQRVLVRLYPTFEVLGTLAGGTVEQVTAARSDRIVGIAGVDDLMGNRRFTPFLWTPTDGFVLVDPAMEFASAVSLESLGGHCLAPLGYNVPCLWNVPQGLTLLPAGDGTGEVFAMNRTGDAAGDVASAETQGFTHCTFWPKTSGKLDCHPAVAVSSHVRAVNDAGVVVGTTSNPNSGFVAIGPAATLLPPLPGATISDARDINAGGLIVGESYVPGRTGGSPNNPQNAVVWDQGNPVDLQTRLAAGEPWIVERALAISDGGVILARGRPASIPVRLFNTPWNTLVLIPLPHEEPQEKKTSPPPPPRPAPRGPRAPRR